MADAHSTSYSGRDTPRWSSPSLGSRRSPASSTWRDTLAVHWDTPLVWRPGRARSTSPSRHSAGRFSTGSSGCAPALASISPRAATCWRRTTTRTRSWPLGLPLFPHRYLRFMASRSSSGRRSSSSRPQPAPSRCAAASATRRRSRRRRSSAGGPHRRHVPGGDTTEEGMRKKYEARAHTGAARSRSRRALCLSPGITGTDRPAGWRRCASPTARPIPLDDLVGREDAPQVATERLMAAIGEPERSA